MFFKFFRRELKPFNTGFLPSKDGHEIYYAEYGNPNGIPVLCFHGGPGGCSAPKHASAFDPKKYRVILHDQRGCGQSTYQNRFYKNTAADLLADATRLLKHLNVTGKVIARGGSWGATLALLFAIKYPERVRRLILNSVFLAGTTDRAWMENISGDLFYPDIMAKIRADAGNEALSAHYNRLLQGGKKDINRAMGLYGGYEGIMGRADAVLLKPPFDENRIKYAQLFFHYDAHSYFIKPDEILKNVKKIAPIPTLIVHNRLDMSCPVKNAFDLYKALPKSKLVVVPDRGHGSKLLHATLKQEIEKILK